jgi:hypothetical protein
MIYRDFHLKVTRKSLCLCDNDISAAHSDVDEDGTLEPEFGDIRELTQSAFQKCLHSLDRSATNSDEDSASEPGQDWVKDSDQDSAGDPDHDSANRLNQDFVNDPDKDLVSELDEVENVFHA